MNKILIAIMALLAGFIFPGVAARAGSTNQMAFSTISKSTSVDLAEVTFTFHLVPSTKSMDVGAQLYVHRASPNPNWEKVNAVDPAGSFNFKVFSLYHGLNDTMQFAADLPKGTYDNYRLLLFAAPDGAHPDFSTCVYDTASDPSNQQNLLRFTVATSEVRVRTPQLIFAPTPDCEEDGNGTYTVTIPAKVRFPDGFQTPQNAVWVMAKGTCGFSQVWLPVSSATEAGDADNPYSEAACKFVIRGVKAGIWSVQFGVFKSDWGDPLAWIDPGLDFEVGGDSWETKSDRMPPRLRYLDGKFTVMFDGGQPQPAAMYGRAPNAFNAVKFVRGGDYGNELDWTIQPALDTPGYFALLGDHGCRFIRVLFDPDRYRVEPFYQHSVDQVVQNIWEAGEYPLIGPQDLPKASTLAQRIALGADVCRVMAETYKHKSIWIEICNEPQEFDTWAQWKPVAEQYVKTIRGIDPGAFVIVPFESWSKDGRGAAASPITDVRVDLYDGHAYVAASEVQARFGTAAAAGLPVLIGEYGGTSPNYLTAMDHAFQAMKPQPVAIAAWAFTIKGQDAMPLVESAHGAELTFTPSGAAVAAAYDSWMNGIPIK